MPITGVRTTVSEVLTPSSTTTYAAPPGLDYLKVAPTAVISVLNLTFPKPDQDAQFFSLSLKNITLLNMVGDPISLATILSAIASALTLTNAVFQYTLKDNTWNRII